MIGNAMQESELPKPEHSTVFTSAFDLFKIGIGPSSSHTMGPMLAAHRFVSDLAQSVEVVESIKVELFGSLAATGHGHGTDKAVVAGLSGFHPENVEPEAVASAYEAVSATHRLSLPRQRHIPFDPAVDIVLNRNFLPEHPNAMQFSALRGNKVISSRSFFSIGGGFIREIDQPPGEGSMPIPFAFATGDELLEICRRTGHSIAEIALANESALLPETEVNSKLDSIWAAMKACVACGLEGHGTLPGGLRVRRRSAELRRRLLAQSGDDPLQAMDWVTLFALAVNEENAAGGRIVTAPTNGAAGIIPAVLHYYERFVSKASIAGIRAALLTAAAIGGIIKRNASISGAEMGCQGEVGSAAAMAAAGLAAALNGSPAQVENAAEIALEHSLGLTCDPVGGLVQIPCIERNAIAAVKAIGAARLALNGDGTHRVSLDQAVTTLRETGRDMHAKYKETSLGGLAVAVADC